MLYGLFEIPFLAFVPVGASGRGVVSSLLEVCWSQVTDLISLLLPVLQGGLFAASGLLVLLLSRNSIAMWDLPCLPASIKPRSAWFKTSILPAVLICQAPMFINLKLLFCLGATPGRAQS